MVIVNQMLRPLLLILFLLLCPALAWAQEDFCGHNQFQHSCPKQADQICHCEDHEFCLLLAMEKPSPKAPAPPRFEIVCPSLPVVVFQPTRVLAPAQRIGLLAQPICPSQAPEPPPPRF